MKNVYIFLANGFEEVEALTVVDLLRRVGVDVKMVSITGEKIVHGAHKIDICSDILFEEVNIQADMLVLPGGGPGTRSLMLHKGLAEMVRQYNLQRKYLAAICAAPSVYGVCGILKGKKATCYPGWEQNLKGAILTDARVVTDSNIITSKGPGTSMEFALCLVSILCGEEKAIELKKGLLYE